MSIFVGCGKRLINLRYVKEIYKTEALQKITVVVANTNGSMGANSLRAYKHQDIEYSCDPKDFKFLDLPKNLVTMPSGSEYNREAISEYKRELTLRIFD